jgi:predicted glycogen debranching enzyme
MTTLNHDQEREWLEADGLGGFASGTLAGVRTRRYHAWLLSAEPDGSRFVLVNGAEALLETASGSWPLSTQEYAGGVVHPDARSSIERFEAEPWPRWIFLLPDGARVEAELVAVHGRPQVCLRWRLLTGAFDRAVLRVRPLLSGRDYHSLHHENTAFRFEPDRAGSSLVFRPYHGVPAVVLGGNGVYRHAPLWYRRFFYPEEDARGLDCEEDLASPGELEFDLRTGPALLSFGRESVDGRSALVTVDEAFRSERERRSSFPSPRARAADSYLVERGERRTLIAGYPWFTDWGRDTFIALRGLCLATGRLDEARAILSRWAGVVSGGMLPNRFPDRGAAPEYNSVDAALWYTVAVYEYLQAARGPRAPARPERRQLVEAVEAILSGHASGARYRIGATSDGLLAAGEPGVQLTWMDAKIGDWVVTPRIGKPVEIQALWLNALWIGGELDVPSAPRWREVLARGLSSFIARFWDPERGRLFDVVDVDHQSGTVDPTFRPNQIFAVGGLPLPILEGARARAVVDAVEAHLVTPLGLRSLAPSEPGYRPTYRGSVLDRDSAYHQGTVWPWLMGPFVEAFVRVRGGTAASKQEAHRRFVAPLEAHLTEAGLGHVSEVADGEAPHAVGGCPFQAWSLGELPRIEQQVLRASPAKEAPPAVALAL